MKTPQPTRIFSNELLGQYRQQADPPADAVVQTVAQTEGRAALGQLMLYLTNTADLTTSQQPAAVRAFLEASYALPSWANSTQMAQGLAFFWKNAEQIALTLGCYSLPYCYAAADGAQVLWLSQRIKDDTFKRLEETGEFLFGVMQERDWHNGKNYTKILKVRLMHAVIRYFTQHSGQWNNAWGVPINQEDMAGTNGAFSYIVVKGLRKLNSSTNPNAEEAYLHLWNVIGYFMGVATELLPLNLREAYHLDRAIAQRQFKPSEAGRGLTRALLKTLQQQMANPNLQNLPTAQMRFLLGDTVANLLDIPEVKLEQQLLKATLLPIFPKSLLQNNLPPSPTLQKYLR